MRVSLSRLSSPAESTGDPTTESDMLPNSLVYKIEKKKSKLFELPLRTKARTLIAGEVAYAIAKNNRTE